MKKSLFALLAAFALTVGTAAAQTTTPADAGAMQDRGRIQGSPDEIARRQTERMTQELGLNADQTAKVQQILLARGQETQAMRGQARDAGNRDQMREQMQAGRARYDAQFKEVLTADQYTKYTTMQTNRMNRGGSPGVEGIDINKMKTNSVDGDKIKVMKPVKE